MPDEVRMLDNRYALLFIRGEHAVKDEKYDILKHPNVHLTTDGGTDPYVHGFRDHAVGSIRYENIPETNQTNTNEEDERFEYESFSSEEIEDLYLN